MKVVTGVTLLAAGFVFSLVSCGKDAAETVANAVTAKMSCNYQAAGYCAEFLVDNYSGGGADQESCTKAGGTYAASACPDSGKIKGCELTTNGLKVSRSWAYNELGVTAVDNACNLAKSQNTPGFSAEFITP